MKIFGTDAFIPAGALVDYSTKMTRTDSKHMLPPDSPYSGSGKNILHLRDTVGAQGITRAGTFEDAMLQALDKVSGAQLNASDLQKEAIINPGSVDIHDITIAQAEATMALGVTRNILSRLVQGWRDLINTR
ncbi:MAG: flagellar hook-basal body complex protein FliE [Treponema sp.]|nr:flagellar hook-basal body complex protein FliE [Treponema sp.]MCL2237008.1 flagellar hook-basal body complex protein FliE [Treponema sp.]